MFSPEEVKMWESHCGVTLESLADLLKDIHNSGMRVQTWENKAFIEALRPCNDVQHRNEPDITHTHSPWSVSSSD